MSLSPSHPDQLEETLESTRANLRKLEIDTHRLRSDLTRLEVALEDGFATSDAVALEKRAPTDSPQRAQQNGTALAEPPEAVIQCESPFRATADLRESRPIERSVQELPECESEPEDSDSAVELQAAAADSTLIARFGSRRRGKYRYATSPVMASLAVHGAIVATMLSITVATIVHHENGFGIAVFDLGKEEDVAEKAAENLDLGQLAPVDDAQFADTISDGPALDVSEPLVGDVTPVDFETPVGPASLGDAGSLGSLPRDLGIEQVGVGGLGADGSDGPRGLETGSRRRGGGGSGRGGDGVAQASGRTGSAMFFGTKSQGSRFVFVVDNSSSMKGGRLELAIAELIKTVEGLSERQSFYVIFVSDQTYPMFYPQKSPDMVAATAENKKRLATWLPNAILASGKNRELINAMDMAAALAPHAVYLLWDGDLKYSEKVRTDVMTHLTRPNQWNFTIHTLGMGVTSLDNAQNLTAIAQSHNGSFRRVDVPSVRPQ